MDTFKGLVMVIVAVTFAAALTFISWPEILMQKAEAAEPVIKMTPKMNRTTTQTARPQLKTTDAINKAMMKCPPGWHVDQVSTFTWSCKPNPITTFNCPQGYNWRWVGECLGVCESPDIPR